MASGFPGIFPGGLTTGFLIPGAVQKTVSGAAGFPGVFPGGLSTGFLTLGAVQKQSGVAHTLSISDSITFAEALSDQAGLVKTDAVTFTDSNATTTGKVITDAITLSESLANSVSQNITDALTFADTATAAIVGLITTSLTDALSFGDSVVTVLTVGPRVCPPDKYRRKPLGWLSGSGEVQSFSEIDCDENRRRSLGFLPEGDLRKPFSED